MSSTVSLKNQADATESTPAQGYSIRQGESCEGILMAAVGRDSMQRKSIGGAECLAGPEAVAQHDGTTSQRLGSGQIHQ